jgi:predicted dehydrogenase
MPGYHLRMTERRMRAAVIGTGFVGPFHVDAVRRAGYAEVAWLVGSNQERTHARARALGVPQATTDAEEVFRDADVDVVHVCTPNDSHVDLAERALRADKHVVVEKPLALSTADARRLQDLAADRGLHGAVAFTYRGYPMVREAQQMVADGAIGALRLVHGAYLQDWLSTETDYNWRLEPAAGASRAVADIGSHWFNTAEYISGDRITAVCADFATFIPVRQRPAVAAVAFAEATGERVPVEIGSEDAATVLVRFASGARGSMVLSQVSPGHKNAFTLELAGSRASLAWAQEMPERLWIGTREDQRTVVRPLAAPPAVGVPSLPAGHPEGWAEALRDVMRAFYGAIAAGVDPAAASVPYPSLADGVRAVALVEAVVESAGTGGWVTVEGDLTPA